MTSFVVPQRTPFPWSNEPAQISPLSSQYLTSWDTDLANYTGTVVLAYDAYLQANGITGGGGTGGVISGSYNQITTDYTVRPTDYLIGVTDTSVPRFITLADPTSIVVGQEFIIKDESGGATANNITLIGLIDSQAQTAISVAYGFVWIYCNGGGYSSLTYNPIPTPQAPPVVSDP